MFIAYITYTPQKRESVREKILQDLSGAHPPIDGIVLAFRLPDSSKVYYCFERDGPLKVKNIE